MEAGATLVNDISASLWPVAAESGVGWVAMHMQGAPRTMQHDPRYDDVVAEVHAFLRARAETALEAGVREVWVDPGIGFGKTASHNLALLRPPPRARGRGFPGARGHQPQELPRAVWLRAPRPEPAGVDERLPGSLATATWAMLAGASMVRVHDVPSALQAATLVGATRIAAGGSPAPGPVAAER